MDGIKRKAEKLKPEMVRIRREIHQNPELGSDLPLTKRLVRQELEMLGLNVNECGGGLTAEIDGGDGPIILLRADMDALPMREESGLPFAAQGNAAHTCGHDLHTAMLLGAAKLLSEQKQKLKGRVRLMFQPDEERARGVAAMMEEGVLDRVLAAVGMHVTPGEAVGRINCTPGEKTVSFDQFVITLKGKGGHGAMPYLAVNPVSAGARICMALESIPSQECAPGSGVVVTVGSFHGGEACNVIPDSARIEGTFRTRNNAERNKIQKRISQIAAGIGEAFRTNVQVSFPVGAPVLINNPDLCRRIADALERTLGQAQIDRMSKRIEASEDFALIAQQVPSMYLNLGTGGEEIGCSVGNHHPKVRYSEDALPVGCAAYVAAALTLLEKEAGADGA